MCEKKVMGSKKTRKNKAKKITCKKKKSYWAKENAKNKKNRTRHGTEFPHLSVYPQPTRWCLDSDGGIEESQVSVIAPSVHERGGGPLRQEMEVVAPPSLGVQAHEIAIQ